MRQLTGPAAILLISFAFGLSPGYCQTCVGGKWDIFSNIWFTDCTPDDGSDGRYYDGPLPNSSSHAPVTVDGDTALVLLDGSTQRVYWRLFWYDNIVDTSIPVPDSIPLLVGLHGLVMQAGASLDWLFEVGNTSLGLDPAPIRVMGLTFSVNASGSNSGTWWWGTGVNGVPTSWAEDVIVQIIRNRIDDAAIRCADAGVSQLTGKHVDVNRVYLRGHSMGGTGAYRMGVKHPDLFAAIHCIAGFADFKGPCGTYAQSFDMMVGTKGELCRGIDGIQYPAREYTDMRWFIGSHRGSSWENVTGHARRYEPPYVYITHGSSDDEVDIGSADRIYRALDSLKYGCSFLRHGGGHGDSIFTRAQWLLGMRRDQSYCAFTNNSTNTSTERNFLDRIGWRPSSIVDQVDHYEVELTGSVGTTDVTLRRLQRFAVTPGKTFHYWIGAKIGAGAGVTADSDGALTIVGIAAGSKIVVEPDSSLSAGEPKAVVDFGGKLDIVVHPSTRSVVIMLGSGGQSPMRVMVYAMSGRMVADVSLQPHHRRAIWNAAAMPPGVYIVRARSMTSTVSRAITLGE